MLRADMENLQELKKKIEFLEKEIRKRDLIIEDFKYILHKKELIIKQWSSKSNDIENTSRDVWFEEKIREELPMLSENQLNLMRKKKKRVEWTSDEIAQGFTMSYFNKRGYNFMINQLKFPLPPLRTLAKKAEKMVVSPGIIEDSFKMLQTVGETKTPEERLLVLSFDEMACKKKVEYHKGLDMIIGPHNQMQVMMARGLISKLKQPMYVDFDQKITKSILYEVIGKLHHIGYRVIATTNDNGGGNLGTWNELDILVTKENMRTWFYHPITRQFIYVFSDAPHCIKLLRNWLLDGGFVLADGTVLTATKLEQLLKVTGTEISPLFKMTSKHLECKGTERQNFALATQLFSHSVAVALRKYLPGDKEANSLADFIELVNSWFDVMNSYSPSGKLYQKPYGLSLPAQNKILDEMFKTISTMKCYNKSNVLKDGWQTFQKAILMSITSLKNLYTDIQKEYNLKYILTV